VVVVVVVLVVVVVVVVLLCCCVVVVVVVVVVLVDWNSFSFFHFPFFAWFSSLFLTTSQSPGAYSVHALHYGAER
jgi:hypothetical protein